MNKFLIICSFMLFGLVSQSQAASLGLISDTQDFGNTIVSPADEDSEINDIWTFTTPDNANTLAISINSVAIDFKRFIIGNINHFEALLDDKKLKFEEVTVASAIVKILADAIDITKHDHTLLIKGEVPKGSVQGSYSGTIVVSTHDLSEVPVPAALWLFGSALMGLVGIHRRRQGLIA